MNSWGQIRRDEGFQGPTKNAKDGAFLGWDTLIKGYFSPVSPADPEKRKTSPGIGDEINPNKKK